MKNVSQLSAGVMLASAMYAFDEAIRALAEHHSCRAGEWLDQLEDRVVSRLQNSAFLGSSFEEQITSIDAAMPVVRFLFEEMRKELATSAPPPDAGS